MTRKVELYLFCNFMHSSTKVKLLIILFFITFSTFSQSNEMGNWLMYFGQNRIKERLSLHTEVQYRNHTIAPVNIEQLLLRTGLNYHLASNAIVTAGYGYVTSYDEADSSTPLSKENRIWQQFILTNQVGRVKFEHRYRVEQRWVSGDYKNRLRYRLMLTVPLNRKLMEPGTVFLVIYDEIFVNTEQIFFDRNRLYGALGYQFKPELAVQVGMLYQRVNAYGKKYLQLALIYNPDLRKNS